MHIRKTIMAVVMVMAALALGAVNPPSAQAHQAFTTDGIPNYRYIKAAPQVGFLCHLQDSYQNHAPENQPGMDHYIQSRMQYSGYCGENWDVGKDMLAMRGDVFMNGNFCRGGGWIYNTYTTSLLNYRDLTDWDPLCGLGWFTHDLTTCVNNLTKGWTCHLKSPGPTTGHRTDR